MLGLYPNFPQTIHKTETYTCGLSRQRIQHQLVQTLYDINGKTFTFEEIDCPVEANALVIFEFGIADDQGFSFLNKEEAKKLLAFLEAEPVEIMDWFCAIRYYKQTEGKKQPLKFDYFMIRSSFVDKGLVHFAVFHERGPRYLTPDALLAHIEHKVNQITAKKILKLKP
jgi:hypothetical protein